MRVGVAAAERFGLWFCVEIGVILRRAVMTVSPPEAHIVKPH